MSTFDDASLVFIPSGYKTSKAYSVKPTDGTGDLTFTRSNDTATRVGPDGLIEKVRTNLALYSQDWTNWTLFQATATANTTANPLDGAVNADTLTISTATTGVSYRSVATGTAIATFSAYLKAGTHDQAQIGFTDGTDFAVNVDLTLGTITGVSSGITGTITSVGSGWYRVTATRTISTTSTPNAFVNVIVGTVGDSVIVFGAQVELGDIATDYIATTTAAVSVGPVSGLPRLDYLNSSCPRLLLEPQRTNLVIYSEQLNNAAWVKQTTTISANSSVSPDGYSNADKVAINNGASGGYVYQSIATTSSTVYTTSFFVKAAGINFTKFYSNVTGSYVTAVINLTTGAITNSGFATTPTATNYGNGWWRVSYTETSGGGSVPIYVDGGTTSNGGGITGNGTDGILIWGAQVEAGAYATSYIPTLGAAVTRGADVYNKTSVSSLIGQSEGTLFVDFTINGFGSPYASAVSVNDGVGNNYVWLTIFSNGNLRAEVWNGSVQSQIIYSGAVVGGRYKMAFGYKTNDFVLYVNGTQVGTDTSGTTFSGTTLSRIDNNLAGAAGNETSQSTNQSLLFKTRLSNADLAALTA